MNSKTGGTPPVQPLNLVDSSSSAFATATKPRSARSTPRASISLLSPGLVPPQHHPLPSEDVMVLEEAQRTLDGGDDAAELKEALRKVLLVADRMSETLASLRSAQQSLESQNRTLRDRETELETSLLLANSNLTLERANNEMLEEALKREGGAAKDIGWKRWSEREGLKRAASGPGSGEIQRTSTPQPEGEDGSRRRSSSSGGGDSNSVATSPTIPAAPSSPAAPAESSRFFKFRFGAGVRDSVSAKISPTQPNKPAVMAPAGFEEANKMVADERKKCAAYEEELEVCRSEKDALKGALQVVEAENGLLRQTSATGSAPQVPSSPIEVTLDDLEDDAQGDDDAGSVSSLQAVKSPTDHKFAATPAQPQAEKSGSSSSPSSPNRLKKASTPPVSYTPVYI
ncbi:hypothetical protein FRC01_004505 [Tulasnella sp. 417]|nr:hypothetical protein FRC01_004505 [Tulasnella sp. 417]